MLWGIAFFNYADRQAVFSVFPLLQREMGLSAVQLGLLGSAFAWVYGLAAPLAGMIVDRVPRKTAILGGLYAWSAICAATVASFDFRHLLFWRAAEGLGESFYFPASMSLISDYHDRGTRSRAMGLHQTSVYAGTIGGGFFAGLIGQHYGWRWSFAVFGMLGILLGIVLQRRLLEPARGAADRAAPPVPAGAASPAPPAPSVGQGFSPASPVGQGFSPAQHPLREFVSLTSRAPTLLCLMGAFMCANFVAVVLLAWMPSYLHDRFGLSLAMSGLTATLFVQLASLAGAPLGGWLADRWRRRTPGGRMAVQLVGVLGGAPFVVLCGLTQSIGWLVVALTAWGLFKGLYDANIFASVFDVVGPEQRGIAAGFMNTIGWLAGGGTAPVVIGVIATRHGLGTAIALASVVYLAAAALLLAGIVLFVRRDSERVATT
jgi:MFS family permease